MKKLYAIVLVLFVLAGIQTDTLAQAKAKAVKGNTTAAKANFGNTDGITAQQMKDYLTFIASDELEGRDTPSRGLDIAAMYIASHLSRWGIKPAGDNGTYFQKVPLKRNKINSAATKLDLNGQSYAYGNDFLASSTSGSASGNIVYASHGWVVKSKNINPYQGIDIKDKIVVVTSALPKGVTFAELQGGKPGVDWFSPPLYAQANGAKAIIVIPTFVTLSNWQTAHINQVEKGGLVFGEQQNQLTIPVITASPRLINALFQREKANGMTIFNKTAAGEPVESFALDANKRINLNVGVKTETISTKNVVGIFEGSDPVLKNEYVAIGAHYDHDGIKAPINGDAIWNGADDDGSGTVAVMAIAEAFSKGAQKPKRSILFIWHAGEEKGLWGSEYFADNPTVPINSIITQLNIDMIGRAQKAGDENHPINKDLPKRGEVYTIGSRMMSTELGELSDATNKAFLNLKFNTRYDDPKDTNRFFYRSDHFNYAKKGIPIIFYMDGVHEDYHQPTDTVDKIDFEQMELVTRTIFATGWELANRATRPKVDKPLPAEVIGN